MSPLLGISLKVLSALSFTLMSAGIKYVSTRFPTGELVFFRSAFALLPLIAWLATQDALVDSLRTRNVLGHLKRGVIGSTGMFCGFTALGYLPLPDTIAIGYTAPLLVVVLAAVILKEVVRFYRWTAVGIGFAGVLIMLVPHFSESALVNGFGTGPAIGALFSLAGAFCAAGATIEVRKLIGTEKTGAIVFYFSMLTTLLGLSTILIGNWSAPTLAEFGLLVVIGILGGIGQILLTQSYRFADASLVAPFEYTTMIWALVIGWFAFGELPAATVLIGAAIVITSGLFVIWREHQLGLERKRAREAAPPRAT
ncbi:DMT family transporter [Chelatococcus sp. SYSU_G07232]|uniref:DMT family transporter n=1 Tax=Chelatococcus albus TaxID=3047466 RepID=A0ABT7AGL2_9HYPH|nr:DMT family transporter [Chelatococcus sp. SYSU_G07232]MDJ1158507.1 DMT family transporter [Chelatococcus sp. SYSU_G07232]